MTPVILKTLAKAKQDKHNKTAKTADNQRQRENFEHIQEKKTHYIQKIKNKNYSKALIRSNTRQKINI